jgi:hypothetical protein
MTGWFGPLAKLDLPCMILVSHAWLSPLWAYNTFSHLLLFSILTHDFFLFLFATVLFLSILFCSIRSISMTTHDLADLFVYKPLYNWEEALSLT